MKKIFIITLAISLLFSLCGCNLTDSDKNNPGKSDRLVGVFMTTEPLVQPDAQKEQNRIYATLTEETYKDDNEVEHTSKTYKFNSLDGIVLAHYQIENGEESYGTTSAGEGICDVSTNVGGEEEKISGTIWMARNSGEVIYYMNPIYQTTDSKVYMIPGDSIHINSDSDVRSNHKLQDEIKTIENSESRNYTFTVEVVIDFTDAAEKGHR